MILDYIPIYKGEMLPTKDMWFHTKGNIPTGATNIDDFKNRMMKLHYIAIIYKVAIV